MEKIWGNCKYRREYGTYLSAGSTPAGPYTLLGRTPAGQYTCSLKLRTFFSGRTPAEIFA